MSGLIRMSPRMGMTSLLIAEDLYEQLKGHPAVAKRLREIKHGESFQINGKEIDPARVHIEQVNGVVRITVDDSADFFTRKEEVARKEQARRNKRPAWKTPYGPQRR